MRFKYKGIYILKKGLVFFFFCYSRKTKTGSYFIQERYKHENLDFTI